MGQGPPRPCAAVIAEITLRVIAPAARLDDLLAEADRRAEVYAETWRSLPEPSPAGESAGSAGLDSVVQDVTSGRL